MNQEENKTLAAPTPEEEEQADELRRKVGRAVEQALADRIAAGTAHPGASYTADAAPDGTIQLTEDDLAACV